jgi:hypothetical protein
LPAHDQDRGTARMRTLLDTARTWERCAASFRRRVQVGAGSGGEEDTARALETCAKELRMIVGLPRALDPLANLPGGPAEPPPSGVSRPED